MWAKYALAQVAYHVPDIEVAANEMAERVGAGPFYVVRNIELATCEHRGQPSQFVHSSAYGQWGDVMVEFVQQDNDAPSPFRDLYAPGESGLHHTACIVDDLDACYQHFAQLGLPLATQAVTKTGTEFSFLDATASLGHFIEVYEGSETLLGFYAFVRDAAKGWRGSNPVRSI